MGSSAGLAPGFRERVDGLVKASHGAVSITSGFRTRSQQIDARKRNGCPDVFNAPASSCRVPTARPGESQHERGLAVDFGGDLTLAAKLAPQFGLRRTVSGEPWHFEGPGGAQGVEPEKGGKVVTAVASAGGDDQGIVDNLIDGARRLLITGLVLAAGATAVAAGAYRATTGRSLTARVVNKS